MLESLPALVTIAAAGGLYMYRRGELHVKQAPADMTQEQIKTGWRKLGFFCELDDQRRAWTLTGSRSGLLYFPDLLLGYVGDPENASNGKRAHFGPYGSLEVMTSPVSGLDAHAIHGTLQGLTHLAELVEAKLAFAEVGSRLRIRDEFAPASQYSLLLDVRADGFDPSTADRERLGAAVQRNSEPKVSVPA